MRSATRRLPSALLTALLTQVLPLFVATPSHAILDLHVNDDRGRARFLFANHMVMQRDVAAPVWGKADPGEPVSVTVASQTKSTVTDPDGNWRIVLDPVPAGGPYDMVIQGFNKITLTDVMFGDVFLLAGQSNLMIRRLWPGQVAEHPEARVFKTSWQDRPGGLPFNFALSLSHEVGVTVGVLQCAMRGSSGLVRTWLGPDAANSTDPFVQDIVATGDWGQSYRSVVAPVMGFAIKGIVWWQGEADMRRREDPGPDYSHIFPAVIESWRSGWGLGAIPFQFLQEPVGDGLQPEQLVPSPLPDANPTGSAGRMRQAYIQTMALENTQVVTSGDMVGGLHPKDRDGYTRRIVGTVLARVYGRSLTYAGPTFQSATLESGGRVRIHFRTNTASGLTARGGPLQGFSISDNGRYFRWANAEIQGEEVVVWNDTLQDPPVVVRYGYDLDYTFANLFNDAGMAAPTFSTDATPYPE